MKIGAVDYYFRKNIFGDILAVYNSSKTALATYSYDAFGNASVTYANVQNNLARLNPFRYRGYYWDSEFNLYYVQSRYYDPEIGRFISPDSIEYITPSEIFGLNLYAYCNNNPIKVTLSDNRIKITNSQILTDIIYLLNKKADLPIDTVRDVISYTDKVLSVSLIIRFIYYVTRYPSILGVMKIDGVNNVPGKYLDAVDFVSKCLLVIDVFLDIYSNIQQGKSAGEVIGSAIYTIGAALISSWAVAKFAAELGSFIGGPIGAVIGLVAGFLFGLALSFIFDGFKGIIFQ